MSASNDLLPSVAGQPNVRLHTEAALDAWQRHPLANAPLSELREDDKEDFVRHAEMTVERAVRRAIATARTAYPGLQHSDTQPHYEFTMIRRQWEGQAAYTESETGEIDQATMLRVKCWLSKTGETSTGSRTPTSCCMIRPPGYDKADHIITTLAEHVHGSENGDQVSRPLWLAIQGLTRSQDGVWSVDENAFTDETVVVPPHIREAVVWLFSHVEHSKTFGSTIQVYNRKHLASVLTSLGKAYKTEMQAT